MPHPFLDHNPEELLRALTQVSHAVSNAESLDQILRLVASQAAGLLGADRSLVLLTGDDGALRIRAWNGMDPPESQSFAGPLDEAMVARLGPFLGELSPEQVLAVPLLVRGRVTGLLAVGQPGGAQATGPSEAVLTALADQTAAPLEIARLMEEVRQAQVLAENVRLQEAERDAKRAAQGGRAILDALMEYIPEGITIADAPGVRIRLVSRFGLELLGRSWSEVEGLSAEEQASQLPMRRPGAESPAAAEELPLVRATVDGAVVRGEEWLLLRPDGSVVALLCDAGPIRDAAGRITGGIMAWREITGLKRIQEQLAQATRLQAVGKLSGGVAHEVNNMMTVVIGFSQDVLRNLPPKHPGRRDLEQVVLAANRAADITRQLLAFSRQQVLQPVKMRLESLLQSLLPLLQRLVGADKLLDFRPSAEPLWVVADRNQLEQVVVNLLANARDAVNAKGRITISTAQRRLDAEHSLSHHGVAARPGEYAAIIVTDTGSGMDAATRTRVFEPFYTTKEMGRGTGLGLATVYGIVKQSDGYIWVYSEPGQGTTIKVYLPLADAGDGPEGPAALPRPERGRETILVVEDEPMVREMTCRNLAALGYTVLPAESGDAALRVVEQTPEIDLVLADVVMPGLSAKQLARRLAESNPDLPVLFMSGYLGDEVVRRDLLSPGVPFLEKPFGLQELGRAVRALLDQSLERRSQPD
jgi:two-component system, cell cycle sensor histidine kinase and response regulator CckA